jgi:hypothetical protein
MRDVVLFLMMRTYKPISRYDGFEIAVSFKRKVENLLSDFQHSVPHVVKEFIVQNFSSGIKFPSWYILPKILKKPWGARPICPQYMYVSHLPAVYLADELNSILTLCPTVLPDAVELVKDLDSMCFPSSSVLFSADVVSLYPSIDTVKGVSVVKDVLLRISGWEVTKIEFITQLIFLVLTSNVFSWHECFFLQT